MAHAAREGKGRPLKAQKNPQFGPWDAEADAEGEKAVDSAPLWVIGVWWVVSGDTVAAPSSPILRTGSGRRGPGVSDNDSNKTGSDKRKQSLYFPEAMLQEIKDEAARLDRSLSWVVQRAWKMARLEIKKIPSVNDIEDDAEPG